MKIKQLFVALASAAMLTACSGGDETVLKGKIIGYNGEETMIFFLDKNTGEYRDVILDVSEDGTIDSRFTLDESLFDAAIFVDKFMFCTCIEKGKKYNAEFDITVPDVETNFRFIGEGAAENEFTRDYNNGFGAAYSFVNSKKAADGYKAYSQIVDSEAGALYSRLERIDNEPFGAFYRSSIDAQVITYKMFYPYLALAEKGEIVSDSDYDGYISSGVLNSLSPNEYSDIFIVLSAFLTGPLGGCDIIDILKIASSTSPDENKNGIALTNLMLNYMGLGITDHLKEAYGYYTSVCKNEKYVSQVFEVYNGLVNMVKGADAPDIEFCDEAGKIYHLSDFKGKAVYVDLWASWCVPCCEEIPYLAKLVEELGDSGKLVCISISTDTDEEAWRAKVAEEKPTWQQFLATDKGQHAISKAYNVNAIPRFMLFDSAGKIVTIDAPRPSEEGILQMLMEAL